MASNRGIGVPKQLLTATAIAACGLFVCTVGAVADVIGQTQDGASCNGGTGMDSMQFTSAGPSYTVPNTSGSLQITDWSTEASPSQDGNLALEVWRSTGTAGTYLLVGMSPPEPVPLASGLNFFHLDAAIPVQPGDLLGLRIEGVAGCEFTMNWTGDVIAEAPNTGTPSVNDTRDFPTTSQVHGFELSVAATVSVAAPPPPPPPPTPASKADCLDGGWHGFTDDQGSAFKNEGDCVSYVATGGTNTAS